MSSDRETTRIVRSWLEEGVTALPDRVLDAVLDQVPATPQRRPWWPTRRFAQVNKYAQAGIAAAAVLVVAVVGYNLLPSTQPPGASVNPTPVPTVVQAASPSPRPAISVKPFAGDFDLCGEAPVPPCIEDPRDDAMVLTLDVPKTWKWELGHASVLGGDWPGGASVVIRRGGGLYSDPCRPTDGIDGGDHPDIAVGPTVADFATALDTHPLLDVTTPVDVTLAGYSGKYLDLLVPADISTCAVYRMIGGTFYAAGSAQRLHTWILDVEGIRVVIMGSDFPGTSALHQAELQSIVGSIQITP